MLIRFRSSTALSEATLTSINQEVGCSTDPLISFRTQLSNIQESVSKTHDAVIFQTTTVNSVLQSISVAPRSRLYATNELPSTQAALNSGEWHNEYTKQETHLNNRASCNYAVSRRPLSPKPMTPLEASPNFFAESYRRCSGPNILSCGHRFFRTTDPGQLQDERLQAVLPKFIQVQAMAYYLHTNTVLIQILRCYEYRATRQR